MRAFSQGPLLLAGLLGLGAVSAQTSGGPVGQNVQVELTTPLKAKKVKAGDSVKALTVVPITLAQGVIVPVGSKVLGHVRQVAADSGEGHTSYIGFSFEEVVVGKGQVMPLNCFIRGALMPASQGTKAPEETQALVEMPNVGAVGTGMRGTNMRGGRTDVTGPVAVDPRPQEAAKPVTAHLGDVIGMPGVELQMNGPDHSSTFRSTHKNLELNEGLQLMLVVLPQPAQ